MASGSRSFHGIHPTAMLRALALVSLSTLTVSAGKVAFELQTNLVSCTASTTPGENTGSAGGNDESISSTAAVAVCAPPESKVFGNIKIMDGTPYPGSTGVRGRLYDVGRLCDKRITDKVDRAWIAFLDCAGCPLSTKLTNLLGSNPQAVLIYNQTSCSFPDPFIQAPPTSILVSTTTLSSTTSIGQDPVTGTTDAPTAAPTAAPTPPPNQGSGDEQGGQDGNGDSGSGDGDHDNQGDPDEDEGEAEGTGIRDSRSRLAGAFAPKVVRPIVQGINSKLHRRDDLAAQGSNTYSRTGGDPGKPYIDAGTTVAMADQVTVDYLFQMLLGPASYSPMPGFLSDLKTTRNHPMLAIASERDGTGDGHSVTDLMVSISPTSVDTASSDSKFLSMSKPVFGVVVGVLCAIICGMVLMFIVRPCMLRHRRKSLQSQRDVMDEKGGELDSQPSTKFNDDDNWDVKQRLDDDGSSAFLCSNGSGSGTGSRSNSTRHYSDQATPNIHRVPIQGSRSNSSTSTAPAATDDTCSYGNHLQRESTVDTEDSIAFQQQHLQQLRYPDSTTEHPPEESAYGPSAYRPRVLPSVTTNIQIPTPMSMLATAQSGQVEHEPSSLTTAGYGGSVQSENDGSVSATSFRNGSDLFHSMEKARPPRLPMIDTNMSMKQDLATELYKQRLSVDLSPASPITQGSRLVGTSYSAGTSRNESVYPFQWEHDQRKSNLDSLRRGTDIRTTWASPRSRTGSSNASTPRASFSEDFKTGARLSLDALRSKAPPSSTLSEAMEHNDDEPDVPSIHRSNDRQGLYRD